MYFAVEKKKKKKKKKKRFDEGTESAEVATSDQCLSPLKL